VADKKVHGTRDVSATNQVQDVRGTMTPGVSISQPDAERV